jgi:hypothetical protein
MLAQRPSFRFLATGALISIFALTFLILGPRSSRDAASRYILKTARPESLSQTHCGQDTHTALPNDSWEFVAQRDALNHGLSDEQCQTAFPKLFVEVDKSVSLKRDARITYKDLDSREVEDGMVRAIIDQGQVGSNWLAHFNLTQSEEFMLTSLSVIALHCRICPNARHSFTSPRHPQLPPSCLDGLP